MKEKIVRDKIPQIIRDSGKNPKVRIAEKTDMESLLTEKLKEETGEFIESKSSEELADILEVVYALGNLKGLSREDLERIRMDKAEARGGFNDMIILEDVE